MGIELKPGDEVEVTGSKVQQNGSDVVLVRELVKGNDTLVMRDDKGIPVWNWKHSSLIEPLPHPIRYAFIIFSSTGFHSVGTVKSGAPSPANPSFQISSCR